MAKEQLVRTRSQQRAVYMNTHADYRMKMKDGTLMVMWLGENGTTLGPIEKMPEDMWKKELEAAIKKHTYVK